VIKRQTELTNHTITNKDFSKALLEAQSSKTMSNIINLADNQDDKEKASWKTVLKKQTKRNILIGSTVELQDKFKAIPKEQKLWLHVSRFRPDLTAPELSEWLELKHGKDFTCEKIISKVPNPKFSSFRISTSIELKETLLKSESWSTGIQVSRYNFFRGERNNIQFN